MHSVVFYHNVNYNNYRFYEWYKINIKTNGFVQSPAKFLSLEIQICIKIYSLVTIHRFFNFAWNNPTKKSRNYTKLPSISQWRYGRNWIQNCANSRCAPSTDNIIARESEGRDGFQVRRKSTRPVSSDQNPGEMSASGSDRTAPRATATISSTLVSSRPRPTALSILRRTIALNEGKLKMRRNARPVRPLLIDARYEETCRMKLSRTLRDHRARETV